MSNVWNVVWPVIVLASVLALFAAGALKQSTTYLAQYLFFTRYSTFFGLVLVLLPIVGPLKAPDMLSNVFVMGWPGAIVTGFAGALYAWTVVYTFRLTWISIPVRCKLPFRRNEQWDVRAKDIAEELAKNGYSIVSDRLALWSLLLAAPLYGAIIWLADGARWLNFICAAAGVALAFGMRSLSARRVSRSVTHSSGQPPWAGVAARSPTSDSPTKQRPVAAVVLDVIEDFKTAPAMGVVHKRAMWFFLTSFAFALLFVVVYHPAFPLGEILPSIAILLFLLMVLTWVFGFIGFVFDKERIPVAMVIILAGFANQIFSVNEHIYREHPWPEATPVVVANQALSSWAHKHPSQRPLAAVAASGGGIRAAYWTAHVLEQLQQDQSLDFDNRLAIISSVSGGSLGSMYYYDRHVIDSANAHANAATSAAGTSSLSATVWGMTYIESLRLVAGSMLNPLDRGWAQETAWARQLSNPGQSLSSIAPQVADGSYPLHIYNACFEETGQRFVLAPVHIEPPRTDVTSPREPNATAVDTAFQANRPFLDLLNDYHGDVRLVTAARLSATFPYVSPLAKSNISQDADTRRVPSYHAADGGYYDNSGLLTTIQVLDRYFEFLDEKNPDQIPRKIALIEIRAAPGDFSSVTAGAGTGGLVNELFGPFNTVVNVQFNSQSSRNRQEIRWLGQLWSERHQGVTLQHYVFYLSGGPLSWHLTEDEKQLIRAHWPDDDPKLAARRTDHPELAAAYEHNAACLKNLREFMQSK